MGVLGPFFAIKVSPTSWVFGWAPCVSPFVPEFQGLWFASFIPCGSFPLLLAPWALFKLFEREKAPLIGFSPQERGFYPLQG